MEGSGVVSVQCIPQKTVNGYICIVQLDNFGTTAKKYKLGTSFSTDVFAMHFPASIGSSSWIMKIYPKGQYDSEGLSNGHLSAYLKLISAENENKSLIVDIDLKIIVNNGFGFTCKMHTDQRAINQCFDWNRKSARWFGGQLVRLIDLPTYTVASVQIECHLKVHERESPKREKLSRFFPIAETGKY